MIDLKRLRAEAGVTLIVLQAVTRVNKSQLSAAELRFESLSPSAERRVRDALMKIARLRKIYDFVDWKSPQVVKAMLELEDTEEGGCVQNLHEEREH